MYRSNVNVYVTIIDYRNKNLNNSACLPCLFSVSNPLSLSASLLL